MSSKRAVQRGDSGAEIPKKLGKVEEALVVAQSDDAKGQDSAMMAMCEKMMDKKNNELLVRVAEVVEKKMEKTSERP